MPQFTSIWDSIQRPINKNKTKKNIKNNKIKKKLEIGRNTKPHSLYQLSYSPKREGDRTLDQTLLYAESIPVSFQKEDYKNKQKK